MQAMLAHFQAQHRAVNAEAAGTLHNTECPTNARHDENIRSTSSSGVGTHLAEP
jgi:hypothetical protein